MSHAIVDAGAPLAQRQLDLLEALLRAPASDLRATLIYVCDLVAAATQAEKVDAFLYDAGRDSLVAVGTSTQPLSMLQRQLGLDVLPVSNGGRVAYVYQHGTTFVSGRLDEDAEELRGIKEALGVRSALGVPLEIGARRRGVLMLASPKTDCFTAEDVHFVEAAGRWAGILAHRAELAAEISRNALEQGRRSAAEELVTVLAHDLRNFLAPLNLRLAAIRMRARREDRDEDARDAEAAVKAVARLSELVSDILDVARIDHGMFRLQPERFDLGALVAESAALLSTPEHPVRVTVQSGQPVEVGADAARIRQCVENVLANALQKSPSQAPVAVFVTLETVRAERPLAKVEVIDQGPGIPAEVLPHVFERFVTRSQGGLGLGLYLAKRIAAVHGGDLVVHSQPGEGARFTLTLPASAGSGAARPSAP